MFSCEKKNDFFSIKGSLLNQETNLPISNIKITLLGAKIKNEVWYNQLDYICYTLTDESGNYELKFNKEVYTRLTLTRCAFRPN